MRNGFGRLEGDTEPFRRGLMGLKSECQKYDAISLVRGDSLWTLIFDIATGAYRRLSPSLNV